MNLLLNSCQALKDGGHIRVSARGAGNFVELRVEDDGPGVPHEIRDSIFDPFFTTRSPNEGLGLGLAIRHQIAVRHGGELRLATSTRGRPSCFAGQFRAEHGTPLACPARA